MQPPIVEKTFCHQNLKGDESVETRNLEFLTALTLCVYSQGHQHLVREFLLNAQGPEKEGWLG